MRQSESVQMKEMRLKKDGENKTIKRLLESLQVREKYYSILKVVHWLSFPIKYLDRFFFQLIKDEKQSRKQLITLSKKGYIYIIYQCLVHM